MTRPHRFRPAGGTYYALSLKQPWAALVVHGIKRIEVRLWATERRGRILIHASKQIDVRPQGWAALPAHAEATAKLTGGIIGSAELIDCLTYQTKSKFKRDRRKHRNDPDWFDGGPLYGFVFDKPSVMPFRRVQGRVRFFQVNLAGTTRLPKLPLFPGSD